MLVLEQAEMRIHLAREFSFRGLVSKNVEQSIDESSHLVSRRPGLVL
jgi:hypothetical protein